MRRWPPGSAGLLTTGCYGKAGGGWVGNSGGFTVTNVTTGNAFASGGGSSAGGWLLGGGVEYAVSNNWSLKGEYDYIGLSNRNFVVPVVVGGAVVDTFTNRSRSISMSSSASTTRLDEILGRLTAYPACRR